MTADEEIRRGEQARLLLENEIFKETFESVESGIINAWRNSPIRDHDGHHELRLMLKLLTDVRRNVETVMQTGKMAKIQIERESMFKKAVDRMRA